MFAKVKDRLDAGVRAAVGPAGTGAPDRPMPSIIGVDMRVAGNLETPGEVHVEGRIDGDVTCSKLIVGATGHIAGHVSAGSVRVHGRVEGSVSAEEVFLLSGSFVSGDIIQGTLEIAPGAQFEGAVRRLGTATPKPEAKAEPKAETKPEPEAAQVSQEGEQRFRIAAVERPAEPEPAEAEASAGDAPAAEAAPGEKPAADAGKGMRHQHGRRREEAMAAAGR